MSTADFVKTSREKLKLTQEELGDRVGKGRQSIIRYEQGDDLPPSVHLAIMHLLTERRKTAKKSAKTKKKRANGRHVAA